MQFLEETRKTADFRVLVPSNGVDSSLPELLPFAIGPEALGVSVKFLDRERDYSFRGSDKNLEEVADALTDILYVTYGAGHAFGINLDKCFEEVQNSNMSKLDKNGKAIYNDAGKVMKGPNYFKPNLSKFVY